MILRKNLQFFTWALGAATVLSVSSCSKDNVVINDEFEIINPGGNNLNKEIEEVSFPAAILGNLGDAEGGIRKCFTNIVTPEDARIILIDSDAIESNEETLMNAYRRDALIVIINPEASKVEKWSELHDIFYAGPDENESCSVYGFNGQGMSYSLRNRIVIDDDDVPLFHLCGWVNSVCGNRYQGVNLRTNDIRKRFVPQRVSHTFNIKLDEKQLVDGRWAEAGQLNLSTTANVTYDIYPIHVFEGDAQGDYYAVEAEMVLHNAPLNNGIWNRRSGNEVTQMSGIYLNRCNVSNRLLRKSNGQFVETGSYGFANGASPSPATSTDGASYNPGFEWGLNAAVSGGIPDKNETNKIITTNSWKWNNTSNLELAGVGISNNSDASDVAYSLLVNGLPSGSDTFNIEAIPDPATGDITFKYSWIWRVSDTDESTADRFYLQVDLNPIYQAYQWITGGKMTVEEFENAIPEGQSSFKVPLTPPNRIRTCSATVRNTSEGSYYISEIKLWRNKTTDNEPDVVVPQTIMTSGATGGGSGVNATMLIIPAGDYLIEGVIYSMENDERVNEHVIYNPEPINLPYAGNITIDFGSDAFKIK